MSDSELMPDPPERAIDLARLELVRLTPSDNLPLQTIFKRVCEIIAEAVQVDRVGIWFLVEDRRALRCANLYERGKREHSEGTTLRVHDFPLYFQALEQAKPIPAVIAASDPTTAELADAYLKPLQITSILDAPIFQNGQLIGVICHEQVLQPREWTQVERDFASTVADLVALKVKAAELLEAKSALRTLNTQLHEIRHLDSLGQFAAGIMGSAGLLTRKYDLPGDAKTLISHIIEAAERGAELTDELMHCVRDNTRATKVINVDELVRKLLPLLNRAIGGRHTLQYSAAGTPGKVFIESASLERVLLNLVLNARDAMPNGGQIRLKVDPNAQLPDDPSSRLYVMLEIQDQGSGIEPALLNRVFEPFFTTKADGKGTGLGLAVVKQVIDRAGGLVDVVSVLGEGTTFRIYLPRVTGD